MRILVISDSHGLEMNDEIIKLEKCDINVHCGDSQLMKNDRDMKQFDMIARGNCDFDRNYQINDVAEYNGLRLMVTHGHYYDVNYSMNSLLNAAMDKEVDIAFYGHTHVVNTMYENGVLIVNPGSLRQSRSTYPQTYMVVEVLTDKFVIIINDASTYLDYESIEITK